MKNSRLLTILLAIAAALVLLTGAIALPILCRPFYYAHIGPPPPHGADRADRGGNPHRL